MRPALAMTLVRMSASCRVSQAFLLLVGRPALLHQALEGRHHHPGQGQIGGGTFLGIEDPDLNGGAVEPGDGAPGVQKFVLQHPFGVEVGDVAVHGGQDAVAVFLFGVDRLGNDRAHDRGHLDGIVGVGVHAGVEKAGKPAVEDGRGGGQGRHDGQQHPDGGVQPGELLVTPEGQVHVHALQVGPAMPLAAENAVEGAVDLAVLMGPQHGFRGRVHEGMDGGGHEPAAKAGQDGVDLAHMGGEDGGQSRQGRSRTVAFELQDMGHQFVGPDQFAHIRIGRAGFAGRDFQNLVGHGQHGQGLAVHDHVFDFDPEGGKKRFGSAHTFRLPVLRRSMRFKNTSTTRR